MILFDLIKFLNNKSKFKLIEKMNFLSIFGAGKSEKKKKKNKRHDKL